MYNNVGMCLMQLHYIVKTGTVCVAACGCVSLGLRTALINNANFDRSVSI